MLSGVARRRDRPADLPHQPRLSPSASCSSSTASPSAADRQRRRRRSRTGRSSAISPQPRRPGPAPDPRSAIDLAAGLHGSADHRRPSPCRTRAGRGLGQRPTRHRRAHRRRPRSTRPRTTSLYQPIDRPARRSPQFDPGRHTDHGPLLEAQRASEDARQYSWSFRVAWLPSDAGPRRRPGQAVTAARRSPAACAKPASSRTGTPSSSALVSLLAPGLRPTTTAKVFFAHAARALAAAVLDGRLGLLPAEALQRAGDHHRLARQHLREAAAPPPCRSRPRRRAASRPWPGCASSANHRVTDAAMTGPTPSVVARSASLRAHDGVERAEAPGQRLGRGRRRGA